MRIKYCILICLLGMTTLLASGQQKNEEPQPAEVGTMDAAWKPVVMNHYFGIRGGYGFGKDRFEPVRQSEAYNGLMNFGLVYRFDAPIQKYVGCIEVDINFLKKGFQYETFSESGIMYSRTFSVIEIPILWQPYLPLSKKNSASRIYLSAGPYLGYALDSHERTYIIETDETYSESKYEYLANRDNRFECGIVIGGGFQVAVKRFAIGVEFRYNIMLSNVMKGVGTYASNPFFSPVDAMNISFGVNYKIMSKDKKDKNKFAE